MKNKRMLVKGCLVVMTLLFFGVSFSSAIVTLKFNVEAGNALTDSILRRNVMPIHFADNGNDFGGFIYFSNGTGYEEDLASDGIFNVQLGTDVKQCKRQMKGIYYNAERGERSWPLDSDTLSGYYSGLLKTEGGIYTLCRPGGYFDALSGCQNLDDSSTESQEECIDRIDKQYAQDNAYYGMLTHTLTGSLGGEVFYLLAGVEYDTSSNQWVSVDTSNPKLVPNFIRFKNRTPVGFVYDKNGGVGFLGCRITNGSLSLLRGIIRDARDKISNGLGLESLFEPDFDANGNEIIKYVNNPSDVNCEDVGDAANSLIKLVIEGLVGMNRESDLGVIGNQTNSKMQYFSSSDINNSTLLNYAKQRSEILCRGKWNKTGGNVVCLDTNAGATDDVSVDDYVGKTLIVKGRNVKVKSATGANVTGHYDVFVNNGNLIIDESNDKFVFDKNGFVVPGKTVSGFNDEVGIPYLSGLDYTGNLVAVGSFIKGNFVVNGKVKAGSGDILNNKYFIYGKFTTKDSLKELEDKFAWRCNNGYTTDGSYCPPSIRGWTNPYENASLVVIDQNYDSLLFGE